MVYKHRSLSTCACVEGAAQAQSTRSVSASSMIYKHMIPPHLYGHPPVLLGDVHWRGPLLHPPAACPQSRWPPQAD